ncbi:hypothetical protein GJ496_011584 [Pomphorhynchus laevis]|nr:hypothetical protein GJ496_011584 [Pomphorhynchus laevis]
MGAAVNTDVSNNEKYTNDIKLDKSKTKNSFKNKIQRIFDIVKKKFRLHKKKSTKNSIKKCESSNASQTKIFPEVCEISSWSESLSNILSSPCAFSVIIKSGFTIDSNDLLKVSAVLFEMGINQLILCSTYKMLFV